MRLPLGFRLNHIAGRRLKNNGVSIARPSFDRALYQHLRPVLRQLRDNPHFLGSYAAKAFRLVKQLGLSGMLRHVLRERPAYSAAQMYDNWVRHFDTLTTTDRLA